MIRSKSFTENPKIVIVNIQLSNSKQLTFIEIIWCTVKAIKYRTSDWKQQTRKFIVGSKSIRYVDMDAWFGGWNKKSIPIRNFTGVSFSINSSEFILHMHKPGLYDLRLAAAHE